jgi:DNA-binding transcriptional LysR family regulator
MPYRNHPHRRGAVCAFRAVIASRDGERVAMELRHLRSFVALAEELHFGRAAQRVFLAQPALSKQISTLEKEMGVSLFERDKRQVVLTTAGAALLEDARRLLTQADGAVERARSAGRGATGMLRIGFIAPALYDLLPPVLRCFRARHPGVRLALEEMHNIEAVNAVRSRYVQLAFVRLPIEPVSELSLVTVRSEPVMLAVPEGCTTTTSPSAPRRDSALGSPTRSTARMSRSAWSRAAWVCASCRGRAGASLSRGSSASRCSARRCA